MSTLEMYEAQKSQSLQTIATTLQKILQELTAIRAAQQQISAKTR